MMPSSLLPALVNDVFARVRAAQDGETRARILEELRLYELDVNLLRDARSFIGRDTLPNTWSNAATQLGFPVWELRDRVGAGWRGALIFHRDQQLPQSADQQGDHSDPWLVYADSHDSFQNSAISSMKQLDRDGKLRPSPLDLRIRAAEDQELEDREGRARLLHVVLDALSESLETQGDTAVATGPDLPKCSLSVTVTDIPADGWEAGDAHEHGDVVTLTLTLDSSDEVATKWILQTCVPFLQPDTSQVEPLYRKTLTLSILLSRAKLVQLIADPRPLKYQPRRDFPPQPTVLHYTDRFSLTHAFVYGRAVRAVCGDWWVPIGDDTTHTNLPICADCDLEMPVAQALKDLLRG